MSIAHSNVMSMATGSMAGICILHGTSTFRYHEAFGHGLTAQLEDPRCAPYSALNFVAGVHGSVGMNIVQLEPHGVLRIKGSEKLTAANINADAVEVLLDGVGAHEG